MSLQASSLGLDILYVPQHSPTQASTQRTFVFAEDLLSSLNDERSGSARNRPLFFIAHSLGGIIVKKALLIAQTRQNLYKDLLSSVYHLIFFGTPHQGASSTAGFLTSLGAVVGGAKDGSLLRELQLWSPTLMEANTMFVDIADGFTITTFFEKDKTHGVQVVNEGSARLNKTKEQVIGLDGNHFEICKFPSTVDPMYVKVIRRLKAEISQIQIPQLEEEHEERVRRLLLDYNVLDRLPVAEQASFNASNKQDDPLCLSETRVEVLKDIRAWAYGNDQSCIFWLNGMAGSGKSTIARTLARDFHNKGYRGASFFFMRGGGDVARGGLFFTTTAKQLAHNQDTLLRRRIYQAVLDNPKIEVKSRQDQWTQLIYKPLSQMELTEEPSPIILIVDALDECDNENDIENIIKILSQAQDLLAVGLRIVVTSRPETSIRSCFRDPTKIRHRDLILQDVPQGVIDGDICLFFYDKLAEIKCVFPELSEQWPSIATINSLVREAQGLFIFAATVCRFVKEDDFLPPEDRLALFLPSEARTDSTEQIYVDRDQDPATKIIDDMYLQILENALRGIKGDKQKLMFATRLMGVVGSIVLLAEPMSVPTLTKLLGIRENDIHHRLRHLHSIINIPSPRSLMPLRVFHPSLRDFLVDSRRCSNEFFHVHSKEVHLKLMGCCLELLTHLKADICALGHPGCLVSSIHVDRISESIPAELQYACRYWLLHAEGGEMDMVDHSRIFQFLQENYLHWLEAMSLLGKTSDAVFIITKLHSLVDIRKAPRLHSFVHDARRFLQTFIHVLTQAPLQIHSSSIVFSPTESIVRKMFHKSYQQLIRVITQLPDQWNACLHVFEGHSGSVTTVVFSRDGSRMASGSADYTVRLWDMQTGQCQHTLEGHSGEVASVVFSPDGSRVASGSYDKTVRVWDVQTGQCQHTLETHLNYFTYVVFSPDGSRMASGSNDKTVRVWDVQTGQCQHTLEGHSDLVSNLIFSPDGSRVASGSYKTVRVWDVQTGLCQHTLKGHSSLVNSVVFSPDGSRVASGSTDRTVRVWDVQTGQCQHTLEGHSNLVSSVVFSPDGSRVASGSNDKTVRVWDVQIGQCQYTLEGHSNLVSSVVFSPDGSRVASGSYDKTVRVWDLQTGQCQHTLEGHSDWVGGVVYSPDGSRVASGS